MDQRPYPQALEAERALLGGFLLDPDQLDEIVPSVVRSIDFHGLHNRAILQLMQGMRLRGQPIDLVTLPERVARGGDEATFGGLEYVLSLAEAVPSTVNLRSYAEVIREKALLRQTIHAAERVIDRAHQEQEPPAQLLTYMASEADRLSAPVMQAGRGNAHLSDGAALCDIDDAKRAAGQVMEFRWTVPGLHELLGVCHTDHLTIFTGPNGGGKTVLMVQQALMHALGVDANGNKAPRIGVGIISMEQTLKHLWRRAQRFLSNAHPSLRDHSRQDFVKMTQDNPVRVDWRSGLTSVDIARTVQRWKREFPERYGTELRVVWIDHLMKMNDPKNGLRPKSADAIGQRVEDLADIGRDYDVAPALLGQLTKSGKVKAARGFGSDDGGDSVELSLQDVYGGAGIGNAAASAVVWDVPDRDTGRCTWVNDKSRDSGLQGVARTMVLHGEYARWGATRVEGVIERYT